MTSLSCEFAAVKYAHRTYIVDNTNDSRSLLIAQNTLAKCPLLATNGSKRKFQWQSAQADNRAIMAILLTGSSVPLCTSVHSGTYAQK